MRRAVRHRLDPWLLLTTAVGLLGCPLLLDDDFSIVGLTQPDAGGTCIGAACEPSDDIGGGSGAGGGGGAGGSGVAGTQASASAGGATDSGGSGGGAGSSSGGGAGSAGGGNGGSAGEGGAEACRTLELTPTYDAESNCIGAHGSSAVVADTGTTVALSYDGGDPCFTGTIAATGWGAVYELTFAGEDGEDVWNATSAGVTGFEFIYRGAEQPSSLRVIYKDSSGVDNCRVIAPGSTPVPFSDAHPGCNASGATVDTTQMEEMILAFVPKSEPYSIDFCVQIRALD